MLLTRNGKLMLVMLAHDALHAGKTEAEGAAMQRRSMVRSRKWMMEELMGDG